MGMRTVGDPFGGPAPLIDKWIGSAFPIVKHVSENLNAINYVVANMALVNTVAQGIVNIPPLAAYTASVAAIQAAEVSANLAVTIATTAQSQATSAAVIAAAAEATVSTIATTVAASLATILAAETSVIVHSDQISGIAGMISDVLESPTNDSLTYFTSDQDLGSVVFSAPFFIEKIPAIRTDLARGSTGTLNLGSTP